MKSNYKTNCRILGLNCETNLSRYIVIRRGNGSSAAHAARDGPSDMGAAWG